MATVACAVRDWIKNVIVSSSGRPVKPANSCNGVLVAVQENGADGPYWNAAAGAWQAW